MLCVHVYNVHALSVYLFQELFFEENTNILGIKKNHDSVIWFSIKINKIIIRLWSCFHNCRDIIQYHQEPRFKLTMGEKVSGHMFKIKSFIV